MAYPPEIRFADFIDAAPAGPPALALAVPLSASGVHGQVAVQQPTFGVSQLQCSVGAAQSTSYTAQHAPIATDAAGRMCFAPGVEAPTIAWAFDHPERITQARLELFCRDSNTPVWVHALDCDPSAQGKPTQLTTWNGAVTANDVVGSAGRHYTFPDNLITAEYAPYKLKLTVQGVGVANPACAWTYLDVLAGNLRLYLAPRQFIPHDDLLPAMNATDARYLTLNEELWELLRRDVDAPGAAVDGTYANTIKPALRVDDGAHAALKLRLRSNLFGRNIGGIEEWYDNTLYDQYKEMWLGGPRVPLVVQVGVKRANGTFIDTAPTALGRVRFLWDWEGGDENLNQLQNVVPGARQTVDRLRTFVGDARNYRLQDCPTGKQNCHAQHGGKRGGAGPEDFVFMEHRPNIVAQSYPLPAIGALVANQFPFVVERCGTRRHAVLSQPRTAGQFAGYSGAVFWPSRIAGDSYRLRVYLAYQSDPRAAANPLDKNSTAQALTQDAVAAGLPSITSSTFTVWRRVRMAHCWKKTNAIDSNAMNLGLLADHFKNAFIELETPAAVVAIQQNDWEAAFRAVRVPVVATAMLQAEGMQYNSRFGVLFRTFDNFKGQLAPLMENAVLMSAQTKNAHMPQPPFSAPDLMVRQDEIPDPLVGNIIGARAGWSAATLALVRTLTDRRLTDNNMETEAKYKAACGRVAHQILEKICARLSNDEEGVNVFLVEFADNFCSYPDVAEAATPRLRYAACRAPGPACGVALNDDDKDKRFCHTCQWVDRSSCTVIAYVPWRYYSSGLTHEAELDFHDNWIGKKIVEYGQRWGCRPDISIAHEIGHHLCMPHAPEGIPLTAVMGIRWRGLVELRRPGGAKAEYHDKDDHACIMSYNASQTQMLHFCGVCLLRLRGWSATAGAAGRVQLFNDSARNRV